MTATKQRSFRRISAPILIVVLAGLHPRLEAHPVPDLPVRTYFASEGSVEVRIEVDPRAFEADPEKLDYLTLEQVSKFSKEEFDELTAKAARFVAERLAFFFEPLGEAEPDLRWEWRRIGDHSDPENSLDPCVLVGSWSRPVGENIASYRLGARELDVFKMGIPLNVVFLNFVDGKQCERYSVLFPGETSYSFDLTGPSFGRSVSPLDKKDGRISFLDAVRFGFQKVIPEGLDHVLFVLGVFVMSRGWKPFLLPFIVFTFAHVLTFWLASAGRIDPWPGMVEPAIAAGIVIVAVENILHGRYSPWRTGVILIFGLFHGLAYGEAASAILEGSTARPRGLLGINVGIELGHLPAIGAAILPSAWIRDEARYRKYFLAPGSFLIALAGIWWFLEKALFQAIR